MSTSTTTENFFWHVHVLVTGICPLHNCAKPIPRPPLRPKPVLHPGRSAPLYLRLLPLKPYFLIWKTPFRSGAVANNNRQTSGEKAIWPLPHCLPAHDGGDLQRTDLIVRLRAVLLPFAVVSMKTRQKSPALVFVSTINGVIRREQAEIKVKQQKFFSCYARLIRRF